MIFQDFYSNSTSVFLLNFASGGLLFLTNPHVGEQKFHDSRNNRPVASCKMLVSRLFPVFFPLFVLRYFFFSIVSRLFLTFSPNCSRFLLPVISCSMSHLFPTHFPLVPRFSPLISHQFLNYFTVFPLRIPSFFLNGFPLLPRLFPTCFPLVSYHVNLIFPNVST